MEDLIKVVLNIDFFLLLISLYGIDVSAYIQHRIAKCPPKLFSFVLVCLFYVVIKKFQ